MAKKATFMKVLRFALMDDEIIDIWIEYINSEEIKNEDDFDKVTIEIDGVMYADILVDAESLPYLQYYAENGFEPKFPILPNPYAILN